ncbi:DUF6988 family protein [Azospirillum sp. ST 5-10]|uniref:DUF6988 family protein n=1 Tax=unclassified Azospirillum TaxID=2630922 RepID=UPI003F4A25CE
MDRIAEECDKFLKNYRWIWEHIDGIQANGVNDRKRLAIGCYHASMEHQGAIHLLVKAGVYGSAFSLYRSVYESTIRGMWLEHCATEDEISRFKNDKPLPIGDMISAIEGKVTASQNVLSAIKAARWNDMCSFAHTGMQAILRRYKEGATELSYSEEEIVMIMNFVRQFSFLSAIGICNISENGDVALKILSKFGDDR